MACSVSEKRVTLHHRAEDLAAHDLVVLPRAGDHGGLVEEAGAAAQPAAGGDLHVAGHLRALDEARDAVALAVADQRADLDVGLVLRADLQASSPRSTGRRRACRRPWRRHRRGRRRCSPGRRCSSRRCAGPSTTSPRSASSNTITGALPPSSRCVRFRVSVAACRTLRPVATSPVSAHHRDLRVLDQRLADRRAAAADHVEHALREDLGGELREQQRGERRLLARLQHHGVAGGQRRGGLPRGHHQRVVPRRDGADHAERVAPDHAGVTGEVFVG